MNKHWLLVTLCVVCSVAVGSIPAFGSDNGEITKAEADAAAAYLAAVEAVSIPPEVVTGPEKEDDFQIEETKPLNHVSANTQDAKETINLQAANMFAYKPNSIYKIYARPERIVDIQLQPGEEVTYIGAGDTVRWVVDSDVSGGTIRQWHIYIKPLQTKLHTNFIINTNKHVYQLDAISGPDYTPIISWAYPQEERLAAMVAKQKEANESEKVIAFNTLDPTEFCYDYKIRGSADWKPRQAFDDGLKTYLQASDQMSKTEAPALFVKEEGKLMLVNYRLKNGYYIIDRLADEFELRVGKKSVTIKKSGGDNDDE